MPNPKTGTVTMDTKRAVEEVKKGRAEYRADSFGNVAVLVGKVSFEAKALEENINSFISLILKLKPSVVKGDYMLNVSLSSTMGPGIKVDVKSLAK
jgi:large subunit ribosomal protein L1